MKNHIEQATTENTTFGVNPVSVKTIPVYKGFWSWLTGKPSHYTIETSFETKDSSVRQPKPIDLLTKQLQEDTDYAWTIHCNIAMSIFDWEQEQGRISSLVECEYKSAAVIERLFNLNILQHPYWRLTKQDLPTYNNPQSVTKAPQKLDTMTGTILSPVKQTVELIDHGKTGLLFREFRRRMGVELEDYSDPTLNSEQPFKSTYGKSLVTKLEAGDARWTEEFFQDLITLTSIISRFKNTTAY